VTDGREQTGGEDGGGAAANRSTAKETRDLAADRGPAAVLATPVVAVVKDLFFVARIRETARLVDVPVRFARSVDEVVAALPSGPRFILLDLTAGFDYDGVFGALDSLAGASRPPVLAFTTHALARQTQPFHARCDRVVTKETLTQELAAMLRDGVGR
jgi:hypothetical protein